MIDEAAAFGESGETDVVNIQKKVYDTLIKAMETV